MNHCEHCGAVQSIPTKRRSRPDHNRLFALIDRAYQQWPENHGFAPTSSLNLRHYLTVGVGHVDTIFIPAPKEPTEEVLTMYKTAVDAVWASMCKRYTFVDIRVDMAGTTIISPRSINEETLPTQREYAPVREAVEASIELALGVTAQQLLTSRAA